MARNVFIKSDALNGRLIKNAESLLTTKEFEEYSALAAMTRRSESEETLYQGLLNKIRHRQKSIRRSR